MSLLSEIQLPFGPERGKRVREATDGFLAWAMDNWMGKSYVPDIVQAGIRAEWATRRPKLGKLTVCSDCGKTTDDPVTVDQIFKICRGCYAKR